MEIDCHRRVVGRHQAIAMDAQKKAKGGYGEGYKDGWASVPNAGPPPPVIDHLPIYFLPPDKTLYEYGYEKGRAEAQAAPNSA